MPIHEVLIERNQQIDAIAEAPHLFNTCTNRKKSIPAPDDGLVRNCGKRGGRAIVHSYRLG
jgi:hypothetical protein